MSASARRKTARPPRLEPLATASPYSRLSIKTLRRRIADGSLTGYRNGPKLILVDLDELDRLVRPIAAAGRGDAA